MYYLWGIELNSMKIVLCDDEETFLDTLETDINSILNDIDIPISILKYSNPLEFIEYYKNNCDIDVVFMDILMGEVDGYFIAKEIHEIDHKTKIIFLTSVTKYALKGYEIDAVRYLIKPVSKATLNEVLKKAIHQIQVENNEFLIEKNDKGVFKIYLSDIKYIETYCRNTMIHTKQKDVLSYRNMKVHLSGLNNHFVRCHSAIIVNLEYVDSVEQNQLKLITGETVPISKYRKKDFMIQLTNYYGNKLVEK